jgi:hypothetical protein
VNGQPGTLRFAFRVRPMYQNYTHIDLILWRRPELANWPPITSPAVYHKRHELLPEGLVQVTHEYQWIEVEHQFETGTFWDEPRPCFYTEYRFVKVNSGGVTLAQSQTFWGAFTLRECLTECVPDYSFLVDQGIPGTSFPLYDMNGLTGPPAGLTARTLVGAYVPMSGSPAFENDNPDRGPQFSGQIARYFNN